MRYSHKLGYYKIKGNEILKNVIADESQRHVYRKKIKKYHILDELFYGKLDFSGI